MQGEIIAVGDELVSGRVVNTTSSFAANRLFAAGYVIARITAVGDDPEAIAECLLAAADRSQFVLVTGGLGPTTDDITNDVVAQALGRRLVLNADVLAKIREVEARRGPSPQRLLDRLAWLPEGAEVLNPSGTAAGYLLVYQGIPMFFLPGVPEELRHHVLHHVLPRLARFVPERVVVLQRVFKVFGLAETDINVRLKGLEGSGERLSVGYYPNFPEVHVTVTVKDLERGSAEGVFSSACGQVRDLLGSAIVTEGDDTLEQVIGRLLVERGGSLGLAESCTGGLLAHRITQVPGSSAWFERGIVAYSNRAKQELLAVSAETLERYGAVSEQTALAMAKGMLDRAGVTHSLSITGIAGPSGGTPEKPVGTVYIALGTREGHTAQRFAFSGTRSMVQAHAAETALDWLRRHLLYGTCVLGSRPATRCPNAP